jgi:hypothetical protein
MEDIETIIIDSSSEVKIQVGEQSILFIIYSTP